MLQKVVDCQEQDISKLAKENLTLKDALSKMELLLDESKRKNAALDVELNAAVHIKEIKKERVGQHGASSWPLYIWDLILEHLVNSTLLSLICASIASMVKTFSPTTKIQLSSIWAIHRARSVLLVIVHTLAAY